MFYIIIFINIFVLNSGVRFNVMFGFVGLLWYLEDFRGELVL